MPPPLWSDRHRDPPYLWPASAIAALVLHGVTLGLLRSGGGNPVPPAVVELVPVSAPTRAASAQNSPIASDAEAAAPAPTAPNFSDTDTASPSPADPNLASSGDRPSVDPPPTSTDPLPATPPSPSPTEPPPSPSPPSPGGTSPPPSPGWPTQWRLLGRDEIIRLNPEEGDFPLPEEQPRLRPDWQSPNLADFPQCVASDGLAQPPPSRIVLRLIVNNTTGKVESSRPVLDDEADREDYYNSLVCILENADPFLPPPVSNPSPKSWVYLEIQGF